MCMEETYVLTLEDKPKRFSELTLNFCGYSICQPRHSFGPAVRPGYILHFILSGRGSYQVGDCHYELKAGEGFLIEPDVMTYYEADAEEPWSYLWIGFQGTRADEMLNQLALSHGKLTFRADADCGEMLFATVYIRPSRYTKEIIDQTDTFSLSILPEKFKTALDYCGSHSGRDEDKFQKTKLDVQYMNGTPWIGQSRLVIFCQKLYAQEFDPYCFADEKLCKQNYRKDDFHTMYIGEITKVMVETRDMK